MSAKPKYYFAIVAHKPDDEPEVFFPPRRCTKAQAIQHARLYAYEGSLREIAEVTRDHGSALYIDATIASMTPVSLGEYAHVLDRHPSRP